METIGSLFSEEIVRAFGWTLLHTLWQGAVIFLLAVIVTAWIRRKGPVARYTALFLLFLLLPAAFAVTFIRIYEPSAGNTPVEIMGHSAGEISGSVPLVMSSQPAIKWYTPFHDFLDHNTHWLAFSWFVGFLILLVRFTGSLIYVNRLKKTNRVALLGHWTETLHDLSVKMGIRKAVMLAESTLVRVPLTAGYLKPVILLPIGTVSGVPPQMIEAILLHELAHIRRRDYLVNILQSFVEIVFFYHPVTWWISGRIREEREHICDDIALSISNDKINYIKALTAMEEQNTKSVSLAPAMTGSRKKLLHRVTRLAYPEKNRKGFMGGIVACLMLAGIILGISANAITSTSKEIKGLYLGIQPEPDTIVTKSSSGKVTMMVYADTIRQGDKEAMQDAVESLEESVNDTEGDKKIVEKKVISNTITLYSDESGDFTWESIPPIPEMPGIPEHYEFYFDQENFEKAANTTEKVIRQELREDGLITPGKSYIIEISSKAMYINGEKQPKDIAKKFQHLVSGLDAGALDENGAFKLVF